MSDNEKKKTKAISLYGNVKYQDKNGNPVLNGYIKIEKLETAIKEAKEAGYAGLWFNGRVSNYGDNPAQGTANAAPQQSSGLTEEKVAQIVAAALAAQTK